MGYKASLPPGRAVARVSFLLPSTRLICFVVFLSRLMTRHTDHFLASAEVMRLWICYSFGDTTTSLTPYSNVAAGRNKIWGRDITSMTETQSQIYHRIQRRAATVDINSSHDLFQDEWEVPNVGVSSMIGGSTWIAGGD